MERGWRFLFLKKFSKTEMCGFVQRVESTTIQRLLLLNKGIIVPDNRKLEEKATERNN